MVSAAELALLRRLKRHSILLYLAATSSEWTTVADLADNAGVSRRRAELGLAHLVTDGYLRRETLGARGPGRLVRYVTRTAIPQDRGTAIPQDRGTAIPQDRGTAIPQDRGTAIPQDRGSEITPYGRARGRAHAGAPPDGRRSKDLNRPSIREGSGEGGGRTDGRAGVPDVRGSDVQWVAQQWDVTPTIAHQNLRKLGELGLERAEARAYLTAAKRGAHPAFGGLEHARYKLGAACSRERVEQWLASLPARPIVRAEQGGDDMTREEHARAAEEARARVRSSLPPREARAVGAAVGRLLREA